MTRNRVEAPEENPCLVQRINVDAPHSVRQWHAAGSEVC
jgi:hypothetical protein